MIDAERASREAIQRKCEKLEEIVEVLSPRHTTTTTTTLIVLISGPSNGKFKRERIIIS